MEVWGFINLMFEDEFTLSVINMVITDFFRSSFGGSVILSKLEEVVKSLFLEEVGVSTEFVERFKFSDFSERMGHSSGFPILEIRSKHDNSFHSFIMFSDSGYENERSITSFILKFSHKGSNLFESEVDEIDVVSGVYNFSFDVFSVGDGVIINTVVGIHNKGEVSDSLSRGSFEGIM